MNSPSYQIADNLLKINAIKLSPQNPFTWASGMRSPIYCDNRLSLSYPKVRNLICDAFALMALSFGSYDIIAGVATAGIPHGMLIANRLDKPFIYVRDKAKGHGRQNQIEGELPEGKKVLLIEDLISTGGSSLKAVEAVRQAGGDVVGVMAIFSYGFEKAKKAFEENNCTFKVLLEYETLINQASKSEYINEAEKSLLAAWNKDPEGWFNKL
jgi:orotate phosphoribosyltransferase